MFIFSLSLQILFRFVWVFFLLVSISTYVICLSICFNDRWLFYSLRATPISCSIVFIRWINAFYSCCLFVDSICLGLTDHLPFLQFGVFFFRRLHLERVEVVWARQNTCSKHFASTLSNSCARLFQCRLRFCYFSVMHAFCLIPLSDSPFTI